MSRFGPSPRLFHFYGVLLRWVVHLGYDRLITFEVRATRFYKTGQMWRRREEAKEPEQLCYVNVCLVKELKQGARPLEYSS
ncbi:unnamed protein product, partial [Amoebophrya sp. A120]|eukprot:GSA120T00015238001.1